MIYNMQISNKCRLLILEMRKFIGISNPIYSKLTLLMTLYGDVVHFVY